MNNPFYAKLLTIGSFFGAIGVMFGAFGAHFLKSRLDASSLDILRTGVLYLFVHVLAMLFVVLLARNDNKSRMLRSAGILFASGIFLFSGSLFIIATQTLTGLIGSYFGIVTPVGGLCFIAGWILLFLYGIRKRT